MKPEFFTRMTLHPWNPVSRCFSLLVRAAAVLLAACLLGNAAMAAPAPQTQVITLHAGWNLISLQVGTVPLTVAAFKNSLDHPVNLIEIWGYQPTGDPLTPGFWKTYQPAVAAFPSNLAQLEPGKGYWVHVSQVSQAGITGTPWDGSLTLVPGWNLVGFPGLVRATSESQDIASVFGTNFGRISQVWTFDSSSAQAFLGYDLTAIPVVKTLNAIVAGQGYWVYALQAVTVSPGPVISLPGDADASPLQPDEIFSGADPRYKGANPAQYVGTTVHYAGPEDAALDLNGNGILDNAYTQDSLRFDVGVDRRIISIGNSGAGLLNWAISLDSTPWLSADVASGTVSSEVDKIVLTANRAGLVAGSYTGTLTVYAGQITKTITVRLDVPTTAGDWKGAASATKVNGKKIGLGEVDMFLNIFMLSDNPAETGFRAVLNRDQSLLFPEDVFMNGVFYSGNQFSLTTNLAMAPADRNTPPYDTFPKPNSQDRDNNGNGKVDVANPFPFTVHREITLLGTRTTPDHMEGTYVEAITGMLPGNQSIFIEGTFGLDRQTLTPTKRSVFNGAGAPSSTVIGGSTSNPNRSSTITVTSPVTIQGVTLTLNVDFPMPQNLVVTLTSPTGQIITLERNPASLASSVTFNLPNFNGLSGQGNWTLKVSWDPTSGERGYFNGWSLDVQGLATYAVTGKLVDASTPSTALGGVHLVLSGSNVIQQADTASDGTFSIPGLLENNYTLSFSRPGYQTRIASFFLTNQSVNVGTVTDIATGQPVGDASNNVELTPVSIADATVQAAPIIGADPLNVNFNLLVPLSQLNASVGANPVTTWDFGDGSTPVTSAAGSADITLTSARHIYTQAGTYAATVKIQGATGSLTRTGPAVLAQRTRPDATANAPAMQVIGVSFVGSFAAPLSNAGDPVQLANAYTLASYDITNDANAPLTNIPAATVYQESKRDSAAFDTDRVPVRPSPAQASDFHPSAEDTDFFVQPGTPFAAISNETADGLYTVYALPTVGGVQIPDRYCIYCTLGGYAFGEQASQVGDFVLQTGRVEPEPADITAPVVLAH